MGAIPISRPDLNIFFKETTDLPRLEIMAQTLKMAETLGTIIWMLYLNVDKYSSFSIPN